MIVKHNESISKYTTIHIGGIAENMYFPENRDELLILIKKIGFQYLIGGGSNLLINDRHFQNIINLRTFDTSIEKLDSTNYYVGASVRLQKLINTINDNGCGGIEYLYSVPGLLGGAVVMNAGGSVEEGWSISDHINSVIVYHNGEIHTIKKEDCKYSHRSSLFKEDPSYIVLGAYMNFDNGDKEKFAKARQDRLNFCRKYQDNAKPNFGSVFRLYDYRVLKVARMLSLGDKQTVHFSHKTENWILNEGNGTFKEALRLINVIKRFHRFLRKDCAPEVIIWE